MPSISRRPLPRRCPFGHPALAYPAPWLCHHGTGCRRRCARGNLLRNPTSWAPVHAPPCHWEHASLSSTPSADFCNRIRRADTPYELSIPAREQGFRLTTGRHWRAPVALASWCVAAPGAGGPRSAPRRLSPPRSTCVDGAVHGPELSSKGARTLLTMCAYPSREAPGTRVAGSNRARPGRPDGSSYRPRLFLVATSRKATASRESRCLPSRQNPYVSEGLLPRARLDRGPVTRSPVETLLGSSRAFVTACAC